MTLAAALVQITAGRDPDENAAAAAEAVRRAAGGGAALILLPEVCNLIEPDRARLRDIVRIEDDDPTRRALADAAKETGTWVLAGSLVIDAADGSGKLANRSLLFDDRGEVTARYDKIHLFDVEIGTGDTYRESDTYRPGDRLTLAGTPWGMLGMTVCYDLRFPHVYRELAKRGAVMLSVPSAFTRPSGEAHWHVLLRARAIETGAFVLAPAQTGDHDGGRKTYGHSLAVAPWGEVLADGGTDVGITHVELDLAAVERARSRIPALSHDRAYRQP